MKITKNKKIFILLIGLSALTSATVLPIVLFYKKDDDKPIKKNIISYADKLKKLPVKEITISATSGDITTNKDAILTKLKNLANFPTIPSGISLEIKDDSTTLTLVGVPITLIVKKEGETNLEITAFKVKRSKTDQEKYVDKLKNLSVKEVTINVTSGDITANKIDILNAIKGLSDFPTIPSGISLEIKDDSTILNTQWASITLIVKKQSKNDLEVTGFKVKRNQSDQEIVDDYFNRLNVFPTKEVTISATSGDITANKIDILNAIRALANFPTIPSGISLEIKDEPTNLTLVGTPVTLVIKKGTITREMQGFKAKKSLSIQEEYANKLKILATKEVTISATSGDITANKIDILNAIKGLSDFPTIPSGISLEIKNDSTDLTLMGVPIILIVKKQNENDLEISGFTAKRSQTDQEIANDYETSFRTSFNVVEPGARSALPDIEIDVEGGTIEDNKAVIINTIKNSYDFVFPPTGFDIRLKPNQNQEITFEDLVEIDIEIFKIDNQVTLATIGNFLRVRRSQTESEFNNSNYEKIKNHFSNNNNKNIGIPFESSRKTYVSLNQEGVLDAVKKALVFNDSFFWKKVLLDKITLKSDANNSAVSNFNDTRNIIIEYGPAGGKSEVTLQISKYTKKETIIKYFDYYGNKNIVIPFDAAISNSATQILEKVKNVLLNENTELWQNLKNYLFVAISNQLVTLEKGSSLFKDFKIRVRMSISDSHPKNITLKVRHYSITQQIRNYFKDEQNRVINIPSTTLDLSTANKILEKIKVNLSVKNPSIWTQELQNNIRIDSSNKTTSIVKNDFPRPFIIEYTEVDSSKKTIILKIKHLEK